MALPQDGASLLCNNHLKQIVNITSETGALKLVIQPFLHFTAFQIHNRHLVLINIMSSNSSLTC